MATSTPTESTMTTVTAAEHADHLAHVATGGDPLCVACVTANALSYCNGCDSPSDDLDPRMGYCPECRGDDDDEYDDGLILIAGVLYDAVTGVEA